MERGYAATTAAAVAADAGVAVDTIYATIGPKPALFRLLIETAISGEDVAVPSEQRAYVKRIRAAAGARAKLTIYAGALRQIHARLAPLFFALRAAGPAHPELAALWRQISRRRARMMRRLAADLVATGETRAELRPCDIADVIWATNAPEFYILLVHERRWPARRFEHWLVDAWSRLLLRS